MHSKNHTLKRFSKIFKKKKEWNKDWLGTVTSIFTFLLVLSLIAFVFFIIDGTIPFFKTTGIKAIFSETWDPNLQEFGIKNILISTFWSVFLTMILVTILSVFNSIFISKFLPKKIKSKVIFMMRFFAGIPSICYGAFGAFVFVKLFISLGIQQPQSMLTAVLVLTIMILPTTISLTVNLFDNVDKKYELAGYALGIPKLDVSFNIIKKICNKKMALVLFFGFCRAIGEVTAIALIAGNGPNAPVINQGLQSFLFSSITTLSSLIGLEVLESIDNVHEGALFFVAFILLLIVFFVNLVLNFLISDRLSHLWKNKKIDSLQKKFWTKFYQRDFNYKISKYYYKLMRYFKIFMMCLSAIIVFGIFGWITVDVIFKGLRGFFYNVGLETGSQEIFFNLLAVIVSTILLILATIIISLPFAFFIAIFLVYYGNSNRFTKKVRDIIDIFIYQFSSTPTILFGMFGLMLFVSLFNLGLTILAASLTMTLIVLPIMIHTIKQNFEAFSREQFYSACALGLKKRDIILKLIVPSTMIGLSVAIILTINKIISESSPILLTLGTSNMFPNKGILSSGRTLATHIFLLQTESVNNVDNIVYQTTLLTFIIIFLFNLLIHQIQNYNKKQMQGVSYE